MKNTHGLMTAVIGIDPFCIQMVIAKIANYRDSNDIR